MKTDAYNYHVPVMLHACIEALNIQEDGKYVDATYGGGGHSQAILNKLGPNGILYAFDQDDEALEQAIDDPRLILIKSNFRNILQYMKYFDAIPVQGILADLGISSHHIDEPNRGFAFMQNGPLDMRMDPSKGISAKEWLDNVSERDLIHVLSYYGEIKNAKTLAKAIIGGNPIKDTRQLSEICKPFAPKGRDYSYLAKVFQAIRIYINDELGSLEEFLESLDKVTTEGSKVVIMSYHSLEDKMVKKWIKSGKINGQVEKNFYGHPLKPFDEETKKPITASEEELSRNNRSRSAKLRVAIRNGQ
jgi:16S rRNA (cytosine1402-N4)-methyltransferase